jgi:hypothetical protein
MEVTNVQDHITHAIIGGKKEVESFGIDESAEFFHVLSNALYSDKPMAVVREILCNAWDAHIESGKTDTPVKVTLNSEKMIIQDFGTGIAPDMIKIIYGTYGRSTKVANEAVTGGFGLGSKAPFAYVDHFEVTSCHNGLKTIYKMSLSNAQVGGKPSISTIVSGPTEETGITVSLNLKDPYDFGKFEQLINKVASFGEMNVELNGEKVDPIPFSTSEHNFVIMHYSALYESNNESVIRVRYGHVVYPISSNASYEKEYSEVQKFLEILSHENHYNYRRNCSKEWVIIIQAEASSLSVTPSRESLSMTDKTIASIKEVLKKTIKELNSRKLTDVFEELTKESINKTWMVSTPKVLFDIKGHTIPNIKHNQSNDRVLLTNFNEIGCFYLSKNYPKNNFQNEEIKMRLDALLQSNFPNRGLIQSYLRTLKKYDVSKYQTNWFQKQVARKLVKRILNTPNLDYKRLYTCSKNGIKSRYSDIYFTPVLQYPQNTLHSYLPFLRNIVILGYTRDIDRAYEFPILKFWLGDPEESLFYHVPRSSDKAKAAREFFHGLGMTVIDLTQAQKWETPEVTAPIVREYVTKPKKKGLPLLDNCLKDGKISTHLLFEDTATRIDKPEFVVVFSSQKNSSNRFENLKLDRNESRAFVELYGKQGGVVANATQEKKFMDLGAKSAQQWILDKLLEEYKTNPRIEEHYRNSVTYREDGSQYFDEIFHLCREDKEMRKEAGLPAPLDEKEQNVITLLGAFDKWEYKHKPELKEIETLIKSWDLTQEASDVLELIKSSQFLDCINSNAIRIKILTGKKEEVQIARKILLVALEG